MITRTITYFTICTSLLIDKVSTSPRMPELIKVVNKLNSNDESNPQVVYACDHTNSNNSFIYCYGKLLTAVNVHSLFPDSKTFVDMSMKKDPDVILEAFDLQFGNQSIENIKPLHLTEFLNEYFDKAGSELETCIPADWVQEPENLLNIEDQKLRAWALELHAIWKQLCRKIKHRINESRHSLISIPHEFIVPGGRFREFYYWDTYWTIKGLLASQMYNTTKAMILNLASFVQRYGFVPNGGRVYYLQRSQPPMLSGMVYEYYVATEDKEFLKYMLPILEKEFLFWQKNRTTIIKGRKGEHYTVYQYNTNQNTPRPESFREDIIHAAKLKKRNTFEFWKELNSAAESGWDFSTRWFADRRTIGTIETSNIVPVDLNALMCWNMNVLQYLYRVAGKSLKARKYETLKTEFHHVMHNVFYNKTKRGWFDYNIGRRTHNVYFYPSIAVPLFAGCYMSLNVAKAYHLFAALNESGAFSFPGGIPTSLVQETREQWDFPNGWGPLNHIIIEGLRKSGNPQMQEQAFKIAQKWIVGNYEVYKSTGNMWEKYNVINLKPEPGEGGEYDVQDGFGWTNGVILDLLTTYSKRMKVPNEDQSKRNSEDMRRWNSVPELRKTQFGLRANIGNIVSSRDD